ncbi:Gfo/Idh/MocA family oxidoreductase [Luteipulveratus sp. YIM 133132]|uniref:Gfo/Idh/MocA family protein n=1 Tax=Luteipulveratus flavus TaxID=3031728 RepID=UPI0023AF50F9|nr:Gfo/Idh/MocA family oxidoreductase [Luteipulveratus sp. YIM 133132]MDE9366384.1 Gfo/Idh/MocA family oxidoreductase [Luteipulveratus sp. YIM 133132]
MTTRIALLGAGGVARRHAEVLHGLDDVQVVAVSDPVRSAAEALAAECGATAFTDADAALDAQPVDAAYVCVPPFAHGEPERAVLARGLPMFVEKPVAADLATGEELAALVADAGVATGTGYHWRCLDVLPEAQDLLAASPPLLAAGYWLDKRPPVPWWSHADRSGGQVVEQLTHVIDLARLLLGEAVEVYAAGARRADDPGGDIDRGDIDDVTVATLRFGSGAVATLTATSLLRAKRRAALDVTAPGLVLELSEAGLVVDNGETRRERRPTEDPKVTVDREFVEVVRGERERTSAPYAEALESHRLACAVTESARTGVPVLLGSAVEAAR